MIDELLTYQSDHQKRWALVLACNLYQVAALNRAFDLGSRLGCDRGRWRPCCGWPAGVSK